MKSKSNPFQMMLVFLALACLPGGLQAQDKGEIGVFAGGVKMFLDEAIAPHIGGNVLLSVRRRIMIGPEIYLAPGDRFRRVNVVGRFEYSLYDKGALRPYVVAAGGFFRELDKQIDYVHYEELYGGGLGLKIRIKRLELVSEAMLGNNELPRLSFGARFAF